MKDGVTYCIVSNSDGSRGNGYRYGSLPKNDRLANEKIDWIDFSRKPGRGEAHGCAEQNGQEIWPKRAFSQQVLYSRPGSWARMAIYCGPAK